jgi:hypothetical protein
LDDWEMVNVDDAQESESISLDTNTSLECHASPKINKSNTLDSQADIEELECDVEVVESPKHTRYSSPLFQELLGQPIEPVKILQLVEDESAKVQQTVDESAKKVQSPSIPEDKSINNLIHTASLVSKTQKPPEIPEVEIVEITTTNNNTNNDDTMSEEAIDEQLLKQLSVAEKRPSVNDPEQVLMKNVVKGEGKSLKTYKNNNNCEQVF